MIISLLVVGECLIIDYLITHICVAVILANWDTHRRDFALYDYRMNLYIPAGNRCIYLSHHRFELFWLICGWSYKLLLDITLNILSE